MFDELNEDVVPAETEQSPAEVVESEPILETVEPEIMSEVEGSEETSDIIDVEVVEHTSKEETETAQKSGGPKNLDKSVATQGTPVHQRKKEIKIDQELVEKTVLEINNIASKHFTNAMLEVGKYLIKEFFYDNIELVKQKNGGKLKSLRQVTKELGKSGDKNYSRTWIYNSIDLVLESKALESVHSYGHLSNSCKVLLLPIKDESLKRELIEKAASEKLSVSKLKELIKQGKPQHHKDFVTFLKKVKSVQDTEVEDIFNEYNAINLTKEEYEELKNTIQIQTNKYENMSLTIATTLTKYGEIKKQIDKYSSMVQEK